MSMRRRHPKPPIHTEGGEEDDEDLSDVEAMLDDDDFEDGHGPASRDPDD